MAPHFTLAGLRDLYRHMEWADACVWVAALGCGAAATDAELRDRLHHMHMTQRAFLEVWTGQPVGRYYELRFPSLPALFRWALPYYRDVERYLASLADEDLNAAAPVPWAGMFAGRTGREPGLTNLGETLFQVTSHSTYHRAQMNTRLRGLGCDPPLVDYVAWIWRERPTPRWPSEGHRA